MEMKTFLLFVNIFMTSLVGLTIVENLNQF